MATPVASKNLYELLGNDPDEDSDREPEPAPKVAEKTLPRSSKRNAPDVAPGESRGGGEAERGGRGGRRGGYSGNDDGFRDRGAGSYNNRGRPNDDGPRQDRHQDRYGAGGREGPGRGRGGRGGRGDRGGYRGDRGDRHSRGLPHDHVKQADQSWGAQTGTSEWTDEKVGEDIAQADKAAETPGTGWDNSDPKAETGGGWDNSDAAGAGGGWDATEAAEFVNPDSKPNESGGAARGNTDSAQPEPEPEDQSKSYAEYLAEQAEKKLKLGGDTLQARKPNEGTKHDKKWAEAKAFAKDEDDNEYIAGKGAKEKRERQRKEKTLLDVDLRYVEPSGGRGGDRGRGGPRRGDFRGGERGRGGRGRGGDGYRGRGDGGFRGGRGGGSGGGGGGRDSASVNVEDENAFPSLGGS